jgi:copper(I)-binding protein
MSSEPMRRTWGRMMCGLAASACLISSAISSFAADVAVAKAWVEPTDAVGGEAVLSMTVTNDGADADALVRAACPFANFSEKRTIDHGEGAPAKRAIPYIPLPPHTAVTMAETGYHVALLQLREKLVEGATFTCSLRFRNAGSMDVEVRVSRSEPYS